MLVIYRLLSSVNNTLGQFATLVIKNIDVDTLPALVIIMRTKSNTEMFTILHANVGANELLTNLMHVVEVFQVNKNLYHYTKIDTHFWTDILYLICIFGNQEQRRTDIVVEEERQARERVKQEQDRAYQESLAADRYVKYNKYPIYVQYLLWSNLLIKYNSRAKEEAKQLEKQLIEEAMNERLAEERRKESRRQAIESSLPLEPQGTSDGVLKVRVRLPAGKFLERRFQSDTPLQTLLNFLIVEGYPTEEYKVLCSWPRRDVSRWCKHLHSYYVDAFGARLIEEEKNTEETFTISYRSISWKDTFNICFS